MVFCLWCDLLLALRGDVGCWLLACVRVDRIQLWCGVVWCALLLVVILRRGRHLTVLYHTYDSKLFFSCIAALRCDLTWCTQGKGGGSQEAGGQGQESSGKEAARGGLGVLCLWSLSSLSFSSLA